MDSEHKRVFISYSHADAQFVRRLIDDLEFYNLNIWVDVKRIKVGQSISKSIEGALESCNAIILILSPQSINSDWVQREYRAALSVQKALESNEPIILPALIENCKIPLLLNDIHYADFRKSYKEGFESLAAAISITIKKIPSVEFKTELIQLLSNGESDFSTLLSWRGPAPDDILLQRWSPLEKKLKQLLELELSLRQEKMVRSKWEITGRNNLETNPRFDNEPWPRAMFYLNAAEIMSEINRLASRYGLQPKYPKELKELFKLTGVEFSN